MNIESGKQATGGGIGLTTSGNVLAISTHSKKPNHAANLTCLHCPEKHQAMSEFGKPYLRCLLLGGPVNPKACGREYAGCEE